MKEPLSRSRTTQARHNVAVIIIHGIGEQRPMETLRSFVDAVLPDPSQGGEKYFSRPDPLSESFELRRLQNRTQPRVQFFEYYWAYKSEGATFAHIWPWLFGLLFRPPQKVPAQLRAVWILSWLFILMILAGAVMGLSARLSSLVNFLPPALLSGAGAVLLTLLQATLLNYMGDAARYLSPMPKNIRLRQEIRSDGIRLLKRIQEQGEYDRVVLVGHSLGSVIAYDILRYAWPEYAADYRTSEKSSQPALAALESIGEQLRESPTEEGLESYRQAQVNLWKELRALGNPWLVTDLITLGSPLAHAALLLASDEKDLRARQRQRELPTDPPEVEAKRSKTDRHYYSYQPWKFFGPNANLKLFALHHGAVFACTRWTNIYFPAPAGLFGDIAGGPLQSWFGPGIRDIAVSSGRFLADHTLSAHLTYWKKGIEPGLSNPEALPRSLPSIIRALDLDNLDYFTNGRREGRRVPGLVKDARRDHPLAKE